MAGGRPKLPDDERRDHVRSVHFSADEIARVEAAAKSAGKPVTAWIRAKVVPAAKRSR